MGDGVIPQIDVAAAMFAHAGFRRDRHEQFRAALETADALLIEGLFLGFGGGSKGVFDAEMLLTLFANRRIGATRLWLLVTALRASDRKSIALG